MDEAWLTNRANETPDQKRARLLAYAQEMRDLADTWTDYPDICDMYHADADIAEADARNTPYDGLRS